MKIEIFKIFYKKKRYAFWEDIDFEFDLMVSDAMENFDIYANLVLKE